MKENPTPDSDSLFKLNTIEDFQVEQADHLAFVRYKNNRMLPNGKTKVFLESRTFQLMHNEWKILSMVSTPGYATSKSSTNIFVHNDSLQ